MENNIFKDAKFGDKFLTRDGCICRYITSDSDEILFNETTNDICQYYPDGKIFGSDNEDCNYPHDKEYKWDIVSRYQEPIDEDKLDKLVHQYIDQWGDTLPKTIMAWVDGFKVGYRRYFMESTK